MIPQMKTFEKIQAWKQQRIINDQIFDSWTFVLFEEAFHKFLETHLIKIKRLTRLMSKQTAEI